MLGSPHTRENQGRGRGGGGGGGGQGYMEFAINDRLSPHKKKTGGGEGGGE